MVGVSTGGQNSLNLQAGSVNYANRAGGAVTHVDVAVGVDSAQGLVAGRNIGNHLAGAQVQHHCIVRALVGYKQTVVGRIIGHTRGAISTRQVIAGDLVRVLSVNHVGLVQLQVYRKQAPTDAIHIKVHRHCTFGQVNGGGGGVKLLSVENLNAAALTASSFSYVDTVTNYSHRAGVGDGVSRVLLNQRQVRLLVNSHRVLASVANPHITVSVVHGHAVNPVNTLTICSCGRSDLLVDHKLARGVIVALDQGGFLDRGASHRSANEYLALSVGDALVVTVRYHSAGDLVSLSVERGG